jgi:sulfate permease, SulP family
MPHPALAAIVIAAMLHLSKPGYLRDLLTRSPWNSAWRWWFYPAS